MIGWIEAVVLPTIQGAAIATGAARGDWLLLGIGIATAAVHTLHYVTGR